jgi:hypothetical protein
MTVTNWYEPMDITIVTSEDGRSTWPEPSPEPHWTRIEKLQWRTGVIRARTGVTVRLNDGSRSSGPGYAYEWPELLGVEIEGTLSSVHDSHLNMFLRGVETGAEAARRSRPG